MEWLIRRAHKKRHRGGSRKQVYSEVVLTGGTTCHAGPSRVVRRRRQEGKGGQSLYWGFHKKGKASKCRINSLGLASLDNFGELQVGMVPGCLILGTRMMKAEEYCHLMEGMTLEWLVSKAGFLLSPCHLLRID